MVGLGSATSEERAELREVTKRRNEMSLKLDSAEWKIDVSMPAEEMAREAANVVRPMMDQMRAAIRWEIQAVLTEHGSAQQQRERGLRGSMVPQ
jgi:hypothetical protein